MLRFLVVNILFCHPIRGTRSPRSYCATQSPRNFHEAQWINAETQKFVSEGHWDCLWNTSNFRFLKAPQCKIESKVFWSDRHWDEEDSMPPQEFLKEDRGNFDRNRHNFFVWQNHRFSPAFTSPKCVDRPISVYGDLTIIQRYVELGEPTEIFCLKCDWTKLYTGRGQKFYTAGEIRNPFMAPKELNRHFFDLHRFQIEYARRGNWKRLRSIGEQVEDGKLLLTGVLLYGTFFCLSSEDERPEVVYNIDTLVSTEELHKANLQPGPVPLISQRLQESWENSWTLKRYQPASKAPDSTVRADLNLQVLVIWSPWSCCKSCAKTTHQIREGRLSVMKIQPDISISNLNVTGKGAQKQLETVGIWLGLGPYRTDGIPLASTLLRSFPRVRHQLLVEFHLIEWDLTNLGVYYERENCPLATPQFNLTSCKKRIVECQESQREANPSRMPRMPEVKPYTPVTPPPELPADSGETHKQIHVGIGTVRHFDVESDSDYLFNCDVGSIGKVSDIRWYKRVHKRARVEVTKWNGHQSAKNQHWFHYQGRMHFHKTKLAFEGQYECGIGTRWIRFNVTFRRTGLGIGLFTAIGYATLVLLLICITVYLYRRMVRWVENDEKMDFDINTIERNEGNNKDEDHEEKDEKLR